MKENYIKKTEDFLATICDELMFEVVDVEFVKEGDMYYLRIYADKEGGIGVEDCADISRKVSSWLDKEDFISENYVLEVSSPGLTRPLKKEKDFARALGQCVYIKTYKPIDGYKEFVGTLDSYDGENVCIHIDEESLTFARKDIALIRLEPEF